MRRASGEALRANGDFWQELTFVSMWGSVGARLWGEAHARWSLLDSGTGSRACESRGSRGTIFVTGSADQARTVGAGCRWLHVTGRGDQLATGALAWGRALASSCLATHSEKRSCPTMRSAMMLVLFAGASRQGGYRHQCGDLGVAMGDGGDGRP